MWSTLRPADRRKEVMDEAVEVVDRNRYSSCRLFLAPTKLVPLSEWMALGRPRLEMNLFKAAMKASVVRSLTISICTALVAKQKNMAR